MEDECPLPLLSLKMFELSRPRPSNTYVSQSWDSDVNEEAVSWGKHLFSIRANSQHKHHLTQVFCWLRTSSGLVPAFEEYSLFTAARTHDQEPSVKRRSVQTKQ